MERILIKKQDSLYFFLILIKMVPMLIPDVYGGYSGYTGRSVYFDSIAALTV